MKEMDKLVLIACQGLNDRRYSAPGKQRLFLFLEGMARKMTPLQHSALEHAVQRGKERNRDSNNRS